MADGRIGVEAGMGEGPGAMLNDILLLAFWSILAIGGLATVVWELVTGRFLNIDGLWLSLISLTVTVVFGGVIAWSAYTGDVQRMLRRGKKKPDGESGS